MNRPTHPLELRFLGGFSTTQGGESIDNFRSAKTRALLVYLAAEGGRAHQRESLIDLLWSEQEPGKANTNFRQSLSRLQRVIDNKAANPPFLTVTRQTVEWNTGSHFRLDVAELQHAVADFATQTPPDAQSSPDRLRAAVDGYGGDFLAGFFVDDAPLFEGWAATVRENLYHTLFRALSLLAAHADTTGDFAQAETYARRQLALIPWDEAAHRRLMQALAMQGQRNEALAQYDHCFTLLQEELGVEPDEETAALYEKIATGVVVAPEMEQELPQPVTSFVGRVAEIGYMVATLSRPDCRILSLTGPGGVGKTRLSLQVAQHFRAQTGQRVVFVPLVGIKTIEQTQAALARELGITLVDPTQATAQLRAALAGQQMLLIFDNAEALAVHAGGAFVAWLDALISSQTGVRLLVASRQPLQAQAEWVLPVGGLAYPVASEKVSEDVSLTVWQEYDAVELFRQRAQQAHMGFAITSQNIADVLRICRAVDGLPLGLELAAAQVRQRSVAEIAVGLDDAPAFLAAEVRDLPLRHRSLHAVMAQSWDLLTPDEQTALARCALFDGAFGRAGARAVLGEDADHLPGLVEKSLLRRLMRPGEVGAPLFLLAPALHTFLNEKHPPNDDDRNRHATFYLAWAADYPATAAAEADNVAAAWRWVQSGHQVDVPAHWDPTWLARLERGHPPVVLAPTVSGQVLVGRATELAHLRTALRPVGKEKRNGGLVVISAPAGMGKTLLVDRLQQETAGVVWFYCPCDETNRQSLYPIRHGLRRYFGQTSGPTSNDDLAAFHARMDDLIQATGDESLRGELEEARSFLAALVDIVLPDSLYARVQREQRRQHFYAAIRALARAESLLQPLIIHLEDAHWLDSESRELLATLLRNVAAYPFAVVATVRPSRFDPPALADAPLHTVALQPLDSAGVAELAAAHLHGEPGRGLVELLLLRAGGNPFHTEQLLIYLRSNGLVAGGELVTAGASGPDIPLPLDIHNVLVARLGRLQGDARSLLAHASVLGQEFSVDELQSVVGGENSVRGALEEESSREIVRPVGSGRYAFNHALFHAATYDSQFDAQKQAYHRKAAQAIASQSGSEQPDFARIAHHWDKAEDQQRAAVGYLAAGDQAQENYFLREAHGYYSRGLALTNDNHQRLDFYLGRERVNHWLGNREEQREDLYRLTELTAGSEDSAQLADISLRRATFALAVADYSLAVQHAQGAAKLAASIYDQALEAQAYHRWGRALWQQGRGESAQPLLRRALRLADSAKRIDVQAVCLYDLAMLAYYADQYDAARTQIAKASALFEAGHDKHNLVRCNNLLGTIAAVEGDIERAIGYYNASLGMCRAVDWPWGEIYCSARLGDCHFDLGDYEACRSLHQLALMLARNVKDRMAEVVSLDTIGLSYQFQGAFEQARQYFNEALALHDTIDYPRGRAFVETHLGQLLADMEETEQAGIHLYNALAQRSSSGSKAAAVDTEAALAWMDMARGDTEFAAERARDVTAWLDENGIAGVELPLLVYWQCYAIFRMIGMADDAARTLAAGYKLLQSRAERIKDPGLRHGFLHNIAHHRHIVAMWEML